MFDVILYLVSINIYNVVSGRVSAPRLFSERADTFYFINPPA